MELELKGTDSVIKSLEKLGTELKLSTDDVVKQLGKTICVNIAKNTEPMGIATKAKQISEKMILGDIARSIASYGRTMNELKAINPRYAATFIEYIKSGNITKAEEFARKHIKINHIVDFTPSIHNAKRNSHGRIRKTTKPDITNDKSSVDSFRNLAKQTIGLCKLGWLQAGQDIKSNKGKRSPIPAWLKKAGTYGSAVLTGTGETLAIVYTCLVKYASNTITPAKMKRAIDSAYGQTEKQFTKALEHITKKFNSGGI